jgi:hypothetical protein
MPLPPPSRQVFARPADEDYSLAKVLHPLDNVSHTRSRINKTTIYCTVVLLLWVATMIWL